LHGPHRKRKWSHRVRLGRIIDPSVEYPTHFVLKSIGTTIGYQHLPIGATHLSNRCHPPIGKAGLRVWLAFGRQQETGEHLPIGATHLSNRCHPPFQSVPPTDWEGRVGGVASIRETAGDGSAVYAPVESDSASFWGRCPRQELPNTAVPLAHRAEARMRLCRSPQSSAATRT